MEGQKIKHIELSAYGTNPKVAEKDLPELKDGQILVKVDASTINPSDRLFKDGLYFKVPLPATCGFDGTGRIVKVQGEQFAHLLNKRICFAYTGTWTQYFAVDAAKFNHFIIDEDVPLSSAASGVVNPLTVLGFYYTLKQHNKHGIIHTAAASALGRQLNRLCISKGVPLLNIVRRKEQVELLKSEGAQHIICTGDADWLDQFKTAIKEHNFDCLFDAIGGGPISNQIFASMPIGAKCHVYGALEAKPLEISATSLLSGLKVEGFLLFTWYAVAPEETKKEIIENYSSYLKNELATTTFKQFKMEEIDEALQVSVKHATQGKVLLKFD